MKAFKKRVKQFVKGIDMFSQGVSFRYNDQKQYETFTGGCISLLLLITFIGIFTTTFLRTLNREYITYDSGFYDQEDPTYFNTTLNDTFMFAVSFSGIDMNSGPRYFDISMRRDVTNKSGKFRTNIPLKPCVFQDWDSIGFGDTYKRIGFDKWLCADKDLVIELVGKFTSDVFKLYRFAASKCNAALDLTRRCRNTTQIDAYLDANESFNFNFYFINTLINPGDDNYISHYLQDVNYFPFSTTTGMNANLFISGYKIQTDQSLYPVEDIKEDVGGVVTSIAQMFNYQIRSTSYMKFYLRKSSVDLVVTRSFRRVDDTLSYIGGLFSTILVGLSFLNLYGQFSYELQIAKNLYYYDKNDPLDSDSFNLLTYFIYLIYIIFEKVGIQLPWPKYHRFHRFLEEVRKQMDMRLIMKKILYSERLGLAILDKPKYKALHLQQPYTLDEAELIRKDHRFYKNFRKKYFPNGEQIDKPNNELTKNESNKALLTPNMSFRSTLKVHNIHSLQNSIQMGSSNMGSNQELKIFQNQIHHQDEFHQLDKLMKLYILELKSQVDRGDMIANRIYQKIDARVKTRYIRFDSQRKLNLSMSLEKIESPQKPRYFNIKQTQENDP